MLFRSACVCGAGGASGAYGVRSGGSAASNKLCPHSQRTGVKLSNDAEEKKKGLMTTRAQSSNLHGRVPMLPSRRRSSRPSSTHAAGGVEPRRYSSSLKFWSNGDSQIRSIHSILIISQDKRDVTPADNIYDREKQRVNRSARKRSSQHPVDSCVGTYVCSAGSCRSLAYSHWHGISGDGVVLL